MDFINIATAIAKAGAVEAENAALRERVTELETTLHLFVKQWNACGPNSDFGRTFSNVRDAAKAALAVR